MSRYKSKSGRILNPTGTNEDWGFLPGEIKFAISAGRILLRSSTARNFYFLTGDIPIWIITEKDSFFFSIFFTDKRFDMTS